MCLITRKLGAKSYNTPRTPNLQVQKDNGESFHDPKRYQRLVERLHYLTITCPDIAFAVSVAS